MSTQPIKMLVFFYCSLGLCNQVLYQKRSHLLLAKHAQLLQTAGRRQPQASPCARRCTGSCRQGRRAGGWGLRGGGWATGPAGCRLGRSKGRHSGSTSRRRTRTCRGWSRSRRWCHSGPASSLQPGRESESLSRRKTELPISRIPNYITERKKIFFRNGISTNSGRLLLFKSQSVCQIHALFTSKGNTGAHVWRKEADFRVLAKSTQNWVCD